MPRDISRILATCGVSSYLLIELFQRILLVGEKNSRGCLFSWVRFSSDWGCFSLIALVISLRDVIQLYIKLTEVQNRG